MTTTTSAGTTTAATQASGTQGAAGNAPRRSNAVGIIVRLVILAAVVTGAYFIWKNYVALPKIPSNIVVVSGRIEGDDSAVAPKTTGRILEVRFREGDSVKAGDTIAVLDDAQVRAREEQAGAAVTAAEARTKSARDQIAVLQDQLQQNNLQTEQSKVDANGRVRQAEADVAAAQADLASQEASFQIADFDRKAYDKLVKTGAASERQAKQANATAEQQEAAVAAARRRLESARGSLNMAQATLSNPGIREFQASAVRRQIAQQEAEIASAVASEKQAQFQLAEAQDNRRDLIVTAPFDGTVMTRAAEPGEVVQAGTAIVTLLDLSKVYLRGFIPEGQIGKVKIGQPARIYLDSNQAQAIDASVERIDPQATFTPENTYFRDDRVKQVVGVKLRLKGALGFAKPGMPADGEILVEGDTWPLAVLTANEKHAMTAAPPAPITTVVASRTVAIRIHDLTKRYGALKAVRGISVEVDEGEIFGLIGPDGAGKTSTFQIAAGVMEATSGSVEIFGAPARQAREHTGYLTQNFSLYPDLTVDENIRYIGDLRRVPQADIEARGLRYLRMFDMDRFASRLAGQLSGGMKQKLALACALVPEPRVLLLDEPTTGVDPVSRREFWDTLAHLAAEGLTILLATPYLDEAERCHRVALMHQGEIHELGTPGELRARLGARRIELRTSNLALAEETLSPMAGPGQEIIDVQRFGDRLDLLAPHPDTALPAVERRLNAVGLTIQETLLDDPTLENTFVARLRALGEEIHDEPFPGRHTHSDRKGQVAIGASGLTKQFGSFTAVHEVSLEVHYGEIYGLLGANGAGKTTTIKMLCGLLDPTSGSVQLAGRREQLRSSEVRQRIGYMSQKFSLYNDLSIEENLEFFAGVYGVPDEEREEKKRWVLAFSGLEGREKQLTGSLPQGWKQRVAFGAAIMHEPRVLFLDEPTSGVDPLARRSFWKMINRLADAGTAILVTTHYLEEAEQCNRLGMMVAGELVAEGTPTAIKATQEGSLMEFVTDQPQRALDLLKNDTERWRVSLFGDRLHIITNENSETAERTYREKLAAAGINVISAKPGRVSLEDVFISVVEKARLQGKVGSED